MGRKYSIRFLLAESLIIVSTTMLSLPGLAQAPGRTLYATPGDWTVTTYRAGDSGAFLRCSAERHYGEQTLTVAKNAAGQFVLGFTSGRWAFEDRSTHPLSLRVDAGVSVSLPGRVRILPVGPIVFVDIDPGSSFIAELSAGHALQISSGDTALEMDLAGSAAAIAIANLCHQDATN